MTGLLRRLAAVYSRYRQGHRWIRVGPFSLPGADGTPVGHIDHVDFGPDSLRVEGWSHAPEIIFGRSDDEVLVKTTPISPNLADTGMHPGNGFSAILGAGVGPVRISTSGKDSQSHCVVAPPDRTRRIIAECATFASFCRTLLELSPYLAAYLLRNDLAAANLLRARTGLFAGEDDRAFDPSVFGSDETPTPLVNASRTPVAVIVPVHDQPAMLRVLLDRVTKNTDLPFHLIVIEDASNDPAVPKVLKEAGARLGNQMEVISFETNRGFIEAANAGLRRARELDRHAILLNSDTLPPPGWASRLIAPMVRDSTVATSTPFSNNAEILSLPRPDQPSTLFPGEGDRIDAVAARLSPVQCLVPVPVGIGFCMGINKAFLHKLPGFDSVFGPGYGEEVDWSHKARAIGGRHVAVGNLFVPHVGSASFGNEFRRRQIARNSTIIARRHPTHDREVARFLASDPAHSVRFVLSLAWLAARAKTPPRVIVAHSLGGGAELWLKQQIAQDVRTNSGIVVLRVGGPARWRMELHSEYGKGATAIEKDDDVLRCLEALGGCRLVYSCGVGFPDPMALVRLLDAAAERKLAELRILFHDFFPVSPSYNLLGGDGRYSGVPSAFTSDPVHAWPGLAGRSAPLSAEAWRCAWAGLLDRADDLVVFSQSSAEIVRAAFPGSRGRLSVEPHCAYTPAPPPVEPPKGGRTIGVLGNINRAKGAEVLVELSRMVSGSDARIVLLGELDPAFRLHPPSRVHGRYNPPEVAQLARAYGIACWLMPSIWPETFSYTTREMVATGLPVFGFALGAQGEVIGTATNGTHLSAPPDNPAAILAQISRCLDRPSEQVDAPGTSVAKRQKHPDART